MIVKDKDLSTSTNYKRQLGDKVESDVAFYLKRQFSDRSDVLVFNDIRIQHNNEFAQIDHLIVYNKGFILIESKSIKGTVKINKQLEWQRTVRGRWIGMPSPITQAELQAKLLKQLLNENAESLLAKVLVVVLQGYFGGRCWDVLCAASNDAIIDRTHIPPKLSPQIVKAEIIGNRVKEIISCNSHILKPNPSFSSSELMNIKYFLLGAHKPLSLHQKQSNDKLEESTNNSERVLTEGTQYSNTAKVSSWFQCKKCQSKNTLPKYGKYGYYVTCSDCDTNTSMAHACAICGDKKTRVSKRKDVYTVNCKCGAQSPFHYTHSEQH
ncbi:NERD domain-containing protein [Vibrio sp. RE86]|uniref:nuclease-related domain-containing protein n=1 Tax=Vibrio sp. RE86 TaxID=2607605 RepID=UPI001493A54E|nr:nuclease-related domain-containing protein [Vibrio sp. RE86]NOH79516.1 NERD domain-containing protein [Vibrio sp. RE86]